jgi:quinol monooxygenase YgiN
VRADRTNSACEIFEDLERPNRFLWTEWWPDPGGLDDQVETDRFRALLGAIRVLGSLESVRQVSRRSASGETSGKLTTRILGRPTERGGSRDGE